jgi:hypothetical protein
MKKGETPQFNEQWWKKARPLLFTDPGLDKKLKDYEVAEDQFNYDKMLKSLGEIREMAKTIVGKCKDTDTVEALKKYPNLISQKETEIKKKQIEAKAKESQNGKPAPQKVGGPVVIWKRDVAEEVKKKYAAKWLDFKGCVVALAGADAGVGFKEATNALDYYNTAQGLANDLLSEVKELAGD